MGEVFDHPEWSDRARQHTVTFQTLRLQAETAVALCARSELIQESEDHVRVAVGDRGLVSSQVDGLSAMLEGKDSRVG